jgi:hypothetical protein
MKRQIRVRRKKNAAALPPLPTPRIAVEETNLTDAERARLADPGWVTEDEADAIMATRAGKAARGRSYGFRPELRF